MKYVGLNCGYSHISGTHTNARTCVMVIANPVVGVDRRLYVVYDGLKKSKKK